MSTIDTLLRKQKQTISSKKAAEAKAKKLQEKETRAWIVKEIKAMPRKLQAEIVKALKHVPDPKDQYDGLKTSAYINFYDEISNYLLKWGEELEPIIEVEGHKPFKNPLIALKEKLKKKGIRLSVSSPRDEPSNDPDYGYHHYSPGYVWASWGKDE